MRKKRISTNGKLTPSDSSSSVTNSLSLFYIP